MLAFGRWLQSPEGMDCPLQMTIVTFDREGKDNGFVEAARTAGLDAYLVRERYRFDLAVIPQLRELIHRLSPSIIETHSNKSHLLIKAISAARRQRRWVAFHHGDTHTYLRQRVYNELDRLTLRSADRIVTVCDAFVPRLVARGVQPNRVRVVHNAVAPAHAVPEPVRSKLRAELNIRFDEKVILAIGRLSREKAQRYLIEALAHLPQTEGPRKLILVGIGPDMDALRRLTGALGLTDKVVFAGFREDVASFYSLADVFVLPSLSEGSSNVLLEAMANGTPVIATRVGGNPEIALHEETALLVQPGNPTALAAAITRLLRDRAFALRLARAGQLRATMEFSPDRYRQRLWSVYEETLGLNA